MQYLLEGYVHLLLLPPLEVEGTLWLYSLTNRLNECLQVPHEWVGGGKEPTVTKLAMYNYVQH